MTIPGLNRGLEATLPPGGDFTHARKKAVKVPALQASSSTAGFPSRRAVVEALTAVDTAMRRGPPIG
ncbi:MAG TPA: hypothetical protein PLM33_01665 [Acidobacteriota bacterium]|nr:hypothetical protein [Acidobacteriota bacterium]